VNRFEGSRGVVLESPAITGEVPEQQLPKTSSARNAKLPVRKGERSTRSGNQEALSWRRPPARQVPEDTQDKNQRRGHRQRRQQTSPAATSPHGAHWGATSGPKPARRQESRDGHYEHPETQDPAVVKSKRRQARMRNISSLWSQGEEIPRPAQLHTRCINNTRIKPTVTIRTLCFLIYLRGSHVI